LIIDSFKLTFESMIKKRLNKTTKLIDMPIESLRTLSKKIELSDAHVKILESSVK